jgi:hypothetical protein
VVGSAFSVRCSSARLRSGDVYADASSTVRMSPPRHMPNGAFRPIGSSLGERCDSRYIRVAARGTLYPAQLRAQSSRMRGGRHSLQCYLDSAPESVDCRCLEICALCRCHA